MKDNYKFEDMISHLREYSEKNVVPMHMPGAKRNNRLINEYMSDMGNPYEIDITEIDGFDNMHKAEGIIKAAFDRTARLYGAYESLFLVNGSTAGNMAAICGVTNKGDCIIAARNCHVSVYNAIIQNELEVDYVYPQYDEEYGYYKGITLKEIKDAVEKHLLVSENIKAVAITSPTYEGNVSDIKSIAEYLHSYNIPLIVDEAHGAHFRFSEEFPATAVECGADIVINSVHKTLPSLTQTAVIHINYGYVNVEKVRRYWNIYQSTSPSYILMGSIDRCMSIIEKDGKHLFDDYIKRLKELRDRLKKLKNIKLIESDDISKIVLGYRSGKELYEVLLKRYGIQLEMSSLKYVIAMTSIFDEQRYYDRLYIALREIDEGDNQDKCMTDVCGLDTGKVYTCKSYVETCVSDGCVSEGCISQGSMQNYGSSEDRVSGNSMLNDTLKDNSIHNYSVAVTYNSADIIGNNNIEKDRNNKNNAYNKCNNYDKYISEVNIAGFKNKCAMKISEALNISDECGYDKVSMNSDEVYGRISAAMVYVYPPGIPILCPGEVVSENVVNIIKQAVEEGLEVVGLEEAGNEIKKRSILCLR